MPNLIHLELKSYGISIAKLQKTGVLNIQTVNADANEINKVFKRTRDYKVNHADISTIAVANEKKIPLVLTDDLQLRKAIESYGLKPVGTIGVIIKAYRENIIGSKELLLKTINKLFEQSSLFISPAFKSFTLEMVKRLK